MLKRKRSRQVAMEILYQLEVHKKSDYKSDYAEMLERYKSEENLDVNYLMTILELAVQNNEELEAGIDKYCIGWTFDRLNLIDIAILKVALTEMLYYRKFAHKISLSEALILAQDFSDESSIKFINGILKHYLDA